jgi:hypothetical protein
VQNVPAPWMLEEEACSHSLADSVVTVSADHFQPQNRRAFAFRLEETANRNRTDC